MTTNNFRIRSFVRRDSRATRGQTEAYQQLWAKYGLDYATAQSLPSSYPFLQAAPCYLEIGFGSGQSLAALAANRPDIHLIGVETYKPGVGSLLIKLNEMQLENVKIFHYDVVDILTHSLPLACLDGVQIFFPDPWPKRRHVARRLIQSDFIRLLIRSLKPKGEIHLATDWDDYAHHMMRVMTAESALMNMAGEGCFADRSPYRPIVTKFEARALREGREIRDLQFILC